MKKKEAAAATSPQNKWQLNLHDFADVVLVILHNLLKKKIKTFLSSKKSKVFIKKKEEKNADIYQGSNNNSNNKKKEEKKEVNATEILSRFCFKANKVILNILIYNEKAHATKLCYKPINTASLVRVIVCVFVLLFCFNKTKN